MGTIFGGAIKFLLYLRGWRFVVRLLSGPICLAVVTQSCSKPFGSHVPGKSQVHNWKPIEYRPNQSLLFQRTKTTRRVDFDSIILDPGQISLEIYSGWDRERDANHDHTALAFFSGPTFEVRNDVKPDGYTAHGDLKSARQLVLSKNIAASKERAYISIGSQGDLYFGFGQLPEKALLSLRAYIGGLHSLTNHLVPAPPSYKGVYKTGLKMSDVRIIYGFRKDGRLEIIETKDGVYVDDLISFVDKNGFLAAYLPDHASKSRLIIPYKRLWTHQKAVWVSGGRPDITHMPLMIKVTTRQPSKVIYPPQS